MGGAQAWSLGNLSQLCRWLCERRPSEKCELAPRIRISRWRSTVWRGVGGHLGPSICRKDSSVWTPVCPPQDHALGCEQWCAGRASASPKPWSRRRRGHPGLGAAVAGSMVIASGWSSTPKGTVCSVAFPDLLTINLRREPVQCHEQILWPAVHRSSVPLSAPPLGRTPSHTLPPGERAVPDGSDPRQYSSLCKLSF